MTPERVAFFDIGTNTILCLIAEISGGSFKILDDLAEITRLGQGVDRTGRIAAEAEERTRQTFGRYAKRLRELGANKTFAVATSAMRDAQNSAEVRNRFRSDFGIDIRVITGAEEAKYSFLAAQNGLPLAGRELLVIDIGGGSTEFIRGNDAGFSGVASLPLGSVRLTERFLRSDPVNPTESAAMAAFMDTEMRPLAADWLQNFSSLTLVGTAGTFTTMAAIEKKLVHYSHSEVHGSTLSLQEVRRQVQLLEEKTIAERKRIPGLEPGRADVIYAGALLIERILTLLHSDRVIVSDQGVRYGLLYEYVRTRSQ
jgi:exopolyphosphatase/guanosine-5'-triphosphate,3'-diphosphate pyrophosphatase